MSENFAKYSFRLGWLQWRILDVTMVGAMDVESRQLVSQFDKDLTELETIAESLVQKFPVLRIPGRQVVSVITRLRKQVDDPAFVDKCCRYHTAARKVSAGKITLSDINRAMKDLLVVGHTTAAARAIAESRAAAEGQELVRQYVLDIDDLIDAVKALVSQLPEHRNLYAIGDAAGRCWWQCRCPQLTKLIKGDRSWWNEFTEGEPSWWDEFAMSARALVKVRDIQEMNDAFQNNASPAGIEWTCWLAEYIEKTGERIEQKLQTAAPEQAGSKPDGGGEKGETASDRKNKKLKRSPRPKRTVPTVRETQALELRTRRYSYQEIGDDMRISKQRAYALCKNAEKRLRPSGRSVKTQRLPRDHRGQESIPDDHGR